jgi:hypothetical protein
MAAMSRSLSSQSPACMAAVTGATFSQATEPVSSVTGNPTQSTSASGTASGKDSRSA